MPDLSNRCARPGCNRPVARCAGPLGRPLCRDCWTRLKLATRQRWQSHAIAYCRAEKGSAAERRMKDAMLGSVAEMLLELHGNRRGKINEQ